MPPAPRPSALEADFQPRLTLRTLTRGDGLLGLRPAGKFGPRGGEVTVALLTWHYLHEGAELWSGPAPTSVWHQRAPLQTEGADAQGRPCVFRRDAAAEADALDAVSGTGLRPLEADALQWRQPHLAEQVLGPQAQPWSLVQEDAFGDFWAEHVPRLQAQGWRIVVAPGFAHLSVPVTAWRAIVHPDTGEIDGHEPAQPLPVSGPAVQALHAPRREGSWLLSLGVEVEGQVLDLAPLVADLVRRDSRWLGIEFVTALDDEAVISLRAPGGKRIDARAAPLKAVVGAMLDLLLDPNRREGPWRLSEWDSLRLEALRPSLQDTQAARAGPQGAWQLQGDAGLVDLAQRLRGTQGVLPVTAPAGLGLPLRPYQLQGVAWLQYLREQHLAGILADDMGLGKTAQVLAHLLIEQQAGRLAGAPALVVLPTSLIANWQAEARRITPSLRVLTLHGPQRADRLPDVPAHDVVLTTYPLLWRDIEQIQAHPFHLLILDEAQSVKNAASRSADAVRRVRARHRLCMTGTPLENHLGELWAQFDFLMPGFLGDARSFKRQWRDPIEVNGETLRARLLAARVRPFILRRRKDEVATELPPRTEIIRRVRLEGRQRELYESVRVAADHQVRRVLARQGFGNALISVLDALLKLRQVCCDPALLKGHRIPRTMERAKLAWLCETLPTLVAEGRRVLVFSQFTELLALVEIELQAIGVPHLVLTGQTAPATRGRVVAAFQDLQAPVLLASLKAGGVGLNLTAADTVIHLDPWWNPAVEQQATDRAHRIGQARPVFVYKVLVEGSIEERILALQARKAALADAVLGQDGAEALKFSEQELLHLLAPLE
ncbi:DEAD/DEAH box helicase [Aquabacterium soli]|uniref:DEAD/DEAH box helicase n=1 Tax=Aquabacterium soli TaxID=2493092 RepID=A0A3R8TPM0_9BURK|nr:DEAD/DEAH box helicase [Aquabacterium soli]RRS00031.1 DEAD/DEAH box helicase [Aquabacterium soli]